MKTKAISNCLGSIDSATVENVRLLSIKKMEGIHNRF